MNDLQTIQRQNNKAVERTIPHLQASGKFVVAEYAGLNFVNAHAHEDSEAAARHIGELEQAPGVVAKLYEPTNVLSEIRPRA